MQMKDTSRLKMLCDVLRLDLKTILLNEVDGSIDSIDTWIEDGLSLESAHRLALAVQKLSESKHEKFMQVVFLFMWRFELL